MKRLENGTPVGMTSPSLYKETEGIVTDSCILYRELDKWALKNGEERFEVDGLAWRGSTIREDKPTHVVDGDYFTIYEDDSLQEISMRFKADGLSYTIRTAKMNCVYYESCVFEKKLDAVNVFHGAEDKETKTESMHQWIKDSPDAVKERFANNWTMPHSLFNIASKLFKSNCIQGINWHKIYSSRDIGNWVGNGERVIV